MAGTWTQLANVKNVIIVVQLAQQVEAINALHALQLLIIMLLRNNVSAALTHSWTHMANALAATTLVKLAMELPVQTVFHVILLLFFTRSLLILLIKLVFVLMENIWIQLAHVKAATPLVKLALDQEAVNV